MTEESGTHGARSSGATGSGPRERERVEDRTPRERTEQWRFSERDESQEEPPATDQDIVEDE